MSENTNPQLLTNSRFSRAQEERDRDAALRSLDDTTLRPAFRYVDPDDTAARPYARARQAQPAPAPAPMRQGRPRRRVGAGAICAIALVGGIAAALTLHATSPRSTSVGLLGVQATATSEQTEAAETNEPQVVAVPQTEVQTEETSAPEPLAEPEAAEPVEPQEVSQPEVAEPEATQEVSQPETYTFTWTDEPQGRGGPREEHTLTYTDNGDSYTIEYDGYTLTVTEEELEWLLGEGWDEQVYDTDWSYGQDTSWDYGDGFGVGPGGRW